MLDFSSFYQILLKGGLFPWLDTVPGLINRWNNDHSDARRLHWNTLLGQLPRVEKAQRQLKERVSIESVIPLSKGEQQQLLYCLKALMPWRKGPFLLYGQYIDSEWRSDWKWHRLLPYITPLPGRKVLDVGCNNGYHLWRMLGEKAILAIGIDPMPLFLYQFEAIKKLLWPDAPGYVLPLGIEQLPPSHAFDTVFSMGVLYHRRSPLDHLLQLKDQLVYRGELVLETLIIDGKDQEVLIPADRYAQMRNVYFIPTIPVIETWLAKCGFSHIRCVDVVTTSTGEQRKTAWMRSASLADFLDAKDPHKTIEGYAAPKRAVFIATKV